MDVILVILPASARLYADMLDGVRRRLGSLYTLQTADYGMDDRIVSQLLRFWHPAGCIVAGAEGLGTLSRQTFAATPVVYLDRTPLDGKATLDVIQDYDDNGKTAARELIRPDIQHYAFVGNRFPVSWSDLREQSFAAAIKLHGKVYSAFNRPSAGDERTSRLEKWLCELPKPVGIFAANDLTAKEVLDICNKLHIRIPDDISLLGIDNIPQICESTEPKISSIAADFEIGGWEAADLLLERIGNPRLRKAIRRYPTIGVVRRASTARSHGYSVQLLRAINLIRARACDGVSVDDVAMTMGCSRRMAEIKFRQATSKTIKSSISTARLERAAVLLRDRNRSLADIATVCGYCTINALRIAFHKEYGLTLSAARRA